MLMVRMLLLALLLPDSAFAQSLPNWPQSYIPPSGDYDSTWKSKLDAGHAGQPDGVAIPGNDGKAPKTSVNLGDLAAVRSQTMFMGGAAQTGTWLQALHSSTKFPIVTPLIAMAPPGGVTAAAWFAGRTSDLGPNQVPFPIINCIALVDSLPPSGPSYDPHTGSWCTYQEGNLTSPTPGRHLNEENSVYSVWDPAQKTPFDTNALGGASNLRLDCGKGSNASNLLPLAKGCSAALEILNNDGAYRSGILFGQNALTPQTDGIGEAIGLAPQQGIKFHYSGPLPAWSILYNGSGGRYLDTIALNDAGMNVSSPVTATSFRASTFSSPLQGSSCSTGQFQFDTSYMYVCTATNHWKRAALADY